MVKQLFIEHGLHNNRVKVFMKFDYDAKAIELIKTLPGVKWSQTEKKVAHRLSSRGTKQHTEHI